jgi:hypothetical protein
MRWLLKRWWFWAGTGFMLVALVVGYLVIPVGEGRVSQASCDRIQLGWSPDQAEKFMGERVPTGGWSGNAKVWEDEDGNAILVHFDQRGIYAKTFLPSEHERSFSETLRRRIKRRIRAAGWPGLSLRSPG